MLIVLATAFVVVFSAATNAELVSYFGGPDESKLSLHQASSARENFLAALALSGVDNVESLSGANPTLTFGSTGITATSGFSNGVYSQFAYSVSGMKFIWDTEGVDDWLQFSEPITAFGSYVVQGGDGSSLPPTSAPTNTLKFRLENTLLGTSKEIEIRGLGPDWPFYNVIFVGVTDTQPFNRISFVESYDHDGLLWDDLVAGFVTPTLTADFDKDDAVTASDLVVWSDNYGTTEGRPYLWGDADGDGDTDGRDFLSWQRQAGSSLDNPAVNGGYQAVPEISTAMGMLTILALVGLRVPGRSVGRWRIWIVLAAAVAVITPVGIAEARQLLVADRLSNSIYRYDEDGTFLNVVLTDNVNLNQPTGIALSSDRAKLYVSSFQTGRVMSYDYNFANGTASNPAIFATENLISPNAILFSQDGAKIYVSNLGGSGVAEFYLDGTSVGSPIFGPVGEQIPNAPPGTMDIFQFSGLAYAPTGELLVGGFQNFPSGNKGAVAKSDPAITALTNFIAPAFSLNGASGLLVHGNDLYVSGMFASNIQRFDVTTGAVDPEFLISDLAFPQQLIAAPDGNGFLVGILGLEDGEGHIAHFDFAGNLIGDGKFADNVNASGVGFTEATAMTVISPLLPGDFNNDEIVDIADLAIWQQYYGESGNGPYWLGDADGDGDTDGRDFLVWQRQFGATASDPLVQIKTIPEPNTLLLLVCALLGVRMRV